MIDHNNKCQTKKAGETASQYYCPWSQVKLFGSINPLYPPSSPATPTLTVEGSVDGEMGLIALNSQAASKGERDLDEHSTILA